jgi:hypothetical protein
VSTVLASAFAAAAAAFLLSTALAQGGGEKRGTLARRPHVADQPQARWWGPPADVRAMLGQISGQNLRQDVQTLVGFGTRNTLSSQADPARGLGAAGTWLFNQLSADAATSGGAMTVQRQSFVQPVSAHIPTPTTMTNILATLQGTDPTARSRYYVVSAHYDDRVADVMNFTSDAPGADEDASGVAAVLELARVMATHPAKATIVFALFDGEEQGLYGSAFSATLLKAGGTNVQGDLNLDTIGNSLGDNAVRDPNTIRLYSEGVPNNPTGTQLSNYLTLGGENDGASRELARFIAETGPSNATRMNVDMVPRRAPLLGSGDHISFNTQGFPAVDYSEANENFDHVDQDVHVQNGVQFGDLPEFLDYGYLTRATRLVGSSLAALARAPEAPVNVQEHTGGSRTNTVSLSWSPNPEPDVVGYEVVWRNSIDQTWTHVILVGSVTTFTTADPNESSALFGVRAINSAGDLSPVAFPTISP